MYSEVLTSDQGGFQLFRCAVPAVVRHRASVRMYNNSLESSLLPNAIETASHTLCRGQATVGQLSSRRCPRV